jgi:hypothetical protein
MRAALRASTSWAARSGACNGTAPNGSASGVRLDAADSASFWSATCNLLSSSVPEEVHPRGQDDVVDLRRRLLLEDAVETDELTHRRADHLSAELDHLIPVLPPHGWPPGFVAARLARDLRDDDVPVDVDDHRFTLRDEDQGHRRRTPTRSRPAR